MKLSLFQFRVISLAVLFLKVSGISTLDRRNMSSIFQNSWNEVKQEFENEIAKHVAENLPQDGIIAQLSLGYTEYVARSPMLETALTQIQDPTNPVHPQEVWRAE